jgi:hypothetical protein
MADVRWVVNKAAHARRTPPTITLSPFARRQGDVNLLGRVVMVGVLLMGRHQADANGDPFPQFEPAFANDPGVSVVLSEAVLNRLGASAARPNKERLKCCQGIGKRGNLSGTLSCLA